MSHSYYLSGGNNDNTIDDENHNDINNLKSSTATIGIGAATTSTGESTSSFTASSSTKCYSTSTTKISLYETLRAETASCCPLCGFQIISRPSLSVLSSPTMSPSMSTPTYRKKKNNNSNDMSMEVGESKSNEIDSHSNKFDDDDKSTSSWLISLLAEQQEHVLNEMTTTTPAAAAAAAAEEGG